MIVFGLYVTGIFKHSALARYIQFGAGWKPQGYLGAQAVGFFFAVGWTPCVGPILGAILTGYLTILNSYAIRLTPQWLWERL